MKKLVLLLILSFNLLASGEVAVEEIVRQDVEEISRRSKAMIEVYYNRQVKLLTNDSVYDSRFRFEKSQKKILPSGEEVFQYDSGIENEIGLRPQIFTSGKLHYLLTPEALKSLNPRERSNYSSEREQGATPSLYHIVWNTLNYTMLKQHRNKLAHNKFLDVKGIKDVTFFNTCQLPIVTSRQAQYIPMENVEMDVKFSRAPSSYIDYVTYGSDAYKQYVQWLEGRESNLVNEQGQIKFLDFLAYYNEFKRNDDELLDTMFKGDENYTELKSNKATKFKTVGEYTIGYNYTKYKYPGEREEQPVIVQMFHDIELLDKSQFPDNTIGQEVPEDKVETEIKRFIDSEVYFNPSAPNAKKVVYKEADATTGYSKVTLKSLKPKILGFFCKSSSSLTPVGSNTAIVEYAGVINSALEVLAGEAGNEKYKAGLERSMVTPEQIEVCKPNGDMCNDLLAKVRRAKCVLATFKGVKKLLSNEENSDYFDLFVKPEVAQGETLKPEDRLEISENSTITNDVAISSSAEKLNKPGAVTIFQGSAIRPQGKKYISCEVPVGATGNLRGFQRRAECQGENDSLVSLRDNPGDLAQDILAALKRAFEAVMQGNMPESTDFELLKDRFYRPDQYSKIGIIYSVHSELKVSAPSEIACVDAIGIRLYGEETKGLGKTALPDQSADKDPINSNESFTSMIDGVKMGDIPNCNTINRGLDQDVAKYELRHCYRLRRNLGQLPSSRIPAQN